MPAASSPDVDLAFDFGIDLSDVPGSSGLSIRRRRFFGEELALLAGYQVGQLGNISRPGVVAGA